MLNIRKNYFTAEDLYLLVAWLLSQDTVNRARGPRSSILKPVCPLSEEPWDRHPYGFQGSSGNRLLGFQHGPIQVELRGGVLVWRWVNMQV